VLYRHHIGLYEQYVTPLLQVYEQHCPGYCAILALLLTEQDISHFLDRFKIRWCSQLALAISPIVHPRRWDPAHPQLVDIWLEEAGIHTLLASILAPRVPQIHVETTLSCLHYLQSGGHSVRSRKSLKPLLKSRYFTRLKMRPSLSRFRKRRHHYSSGRCLLDEQALHSTWWGDLPCYPKDYIGRHRGIRVPFCFFCFRLEYASNYDLWRTYRHALQLLPILLVEAPPDSQLASIAANCIFNSFCTAYPRETRKAKESITQYLFRCRPIRAVPLRTRIVVNGMNGMDVD